MAVVLKEQLVSQAGQRSMQKSGMDNASANEESRTTSLLRGMLELGSRTNQEGSTSGNATETQ